MKLLNANWKTLGEAVDGAESALLDADLFYGHGLETAYDEAAYIVLHTLKLPLDDLDGVWDRALTATERNALQTIISRRANEHIPAAYLTHEAWLGPHRFYVDERVIVPRSFIAELLHEELFPWVVDPDAVLHALDLCTGSGCLAIVAALTFPNAKVDAVDLSSDALDVAQRNVTDYTLTDRITLIASDLFEALAGKTYDVIVTNPPYVTGDSMRELPDEYRKEPAMALASGEDGLDHVRQILQAAPTYLNPNGLLIVEVGFNRDGVEAAFPTLPFTWAETSAGDGVVFLITREELLGAATSQT